MWCFYFESSVFISCGHKYKWGNGQRLFCCGVTNIAIFLLYLATFPTPLSNFFSIIETSKNSPNSSRNVRNIFISYTVEGKGPNFGLKRFCHAAIMFLLTHSRARLWGWIFQYGVYPPPNEGLFIVFKWVFSLKSNLICQSWANMIYHSKSVHRSQSMFTKTSGRNTDTIASGMTGQTGRYVFINTCQNGF